ncbi:TerB N-terminal domain-containing protein [Isosphaeraceae bacterium EP7]
MSISLDPSRLLSGLTRHVPVSPPQILTWRGRGETIHVGRYAIRDPLVYTSGGRGKHDEASCIDLALKVGKPVVEPRGSLGYWPKYAHITADQRANYLQWLAGGRSGPLDDIGYAFLFFYGLERRLLVDGEDLSLVAKEAVRLLETYTFSGSFDGYLSRFLSYSLAKVDIGTLKEAWFRAVFERTRSRKDEQHLAVGLAWLFKQQRPLPSAWAFRLAKLDPRSPRSVVLDRLPDQFGFLFSKRYAEQFGDGLKLRVAKRDREVSYQLASPSLHEILGARRGLEPVRVPNVLGIQSQFAPLAKIWTACIEELKPLSRVMARGVEVATRAAYDALPEGLKSDPSIRIGCGGRRSPRVMQGRTGRSSSRSVRSRTSTGSSRGRG